MISGLVGPGLPYSTASISLVISLVPRFPTSPFGRTSVTSRLSLLMSSSMFKCHLESSFNSNKNLAIQHSSSFWSSESAAFIQRRIINNLCLFRRAIITCPQKIGNCKVKFLLSQPLAQECRILQINNHPITTATPSTPHESNVTRAPELGTLVVVNGAVAVFEDDGSSVPGAG